MPTPKAAEANADAHRQEDDEEDEHDDQDVAAIPEDAEPRDGGGGGGGGGDGATPGAGGSLSNALTSKRFLLLLAAVAAAFVAYRYYQQQGGDLSNVKEKVQPDTVQDESEDGQGPEPMPNIKKDPEDPLRADDEAFKWVFGDQAQAESEYPGR